MRRFLAGVLLAWSALVGPAARGDIYYTFDPTSASGQDFHVNLAAGASTNLSIYLAFTGADASSLLAEQGLFGADVQMVRTGLVPSDPVGIASAGNVQGSAAFDDPAGAIVTYASSGDVDLLQSINPLDAAGVTGGPLGLAQQAILLGTFTFTAGNTPGQTTVFQAQDFPNSSDTVTFTNNLVLDALIGNAQVTFVTTAAGSGGSGAATPLPRAAESALVLLAVLAVIKLTYRTQARVG